MQAIFPLESSQVATTAEGTPSARLLLRSAESTSANRKHAGYGARLPVQANWDCWIQATKQPVLRGNSKSQANAYIDVQGFGYGLEIGLWCQTADTGGALRPYWAYTTPSGQTGKMVGSAFPVGTPILCSLRRIAGHKYTAYINGVAVKSAMVMEASNNTIGVGMEMECYHSAEGSNPNDAAWLFSKVNGPNLTAFNKIQVSPYVASLVSNTSFRAYKG